MTKAISLFSGAGGDTLGMKNADIDVVGFIENDPDAIDTHITNFPLCKLIGQDITSIPDDTFYEYRNNIDIIFGGFPCQSFSHGGKKNPEDERGQLYKEFIRITNIIRPTIIIGENVKGLLTRQASNGTLILSNIISEFNDIGYTLIYKTINCENFGIPQRRSRVVIIGIRSNSGINIRDINIPVGNSHQATIRGICQFSLRNAIQIHKQNIIDLIPTNKFITEITNIDTVFGKPPANLVKCYNQDYLSFKTRSKSVFSGIEDLDSPTHTILCTYSRMPRLFIPLQNRLGIYLRAFSVNELQQIQGFPVTFIFKGTENSQIKQIGNAVPPVVITEIITYLLTLL